MREGVRVREITNDEGNRLLRIVRRSSGSVVDVATGTDGAVSAQGKEEELKPGGLRAHHCSVRRADPGGGPILVANPWSLNRG